MSLSIVSITADRLSNSRAAVYIVNSLGINIKVMMNNEQYADEVEDKKKKNITILMFFPNRSMRSCFTMMLGAFTSMATKNLTLRWMLQMPSS